MSSAPLVPVMSSVPFSTWAVVAAVACATVKPSAAAASAPAASARDLMVAYMRGSFAWGGAAMLPGPRRQRNARVFARRPEVFRRSLALGSGPENTTVADARPVRQIRHCDVTT